MTEAQWQQQVVELAALYGWSSYHTYDSRRSHPGWPDLVLCRPPEIVFVELKTDKGRLSAAQCEWLERLAASGQRVFVWRPSMFDAIHRILKRRREGVIPRC